MIVFYLKYKGIGGVQVLMLNLIRSLYTQNIIVKLIYYRDSWLISELSKENIQFNLFDLDEDKIENVHTFLTNNDTLVLTGFVNDLYEIRKVNPKVLFWIVFPDTFIYSTRFRVVQHFMFKRFIEKLERENGLVFMDKPGADSTLKKYNLSLKPKYIPIPIFLEEGKIVPKTKVNNKSISFCYVGRAVDWKVYPARKLLLDLDKNASAIDLEVKVTIVTDNISQFSNLLNYTPDNIHISYIENLNNNELGIFLKENIDINVAMGTAILESASCRVPSISIDASYSEFPENYKYHWLFDNDSFSLGEIINDKSSFKGFTIQDLFENIINKANYLDQVSLSCYSYVKSNHDLIYITTLFQSQIEKTCFRFRNVKFRNPFYYLYLIKKFYGKVSN